MIEMPTDEPTERVRLSRLDPSVRKLRRQRGEGGRVERDEHEADAEALDQAR